MHRMSLYTFAAENDYETAKHNNSTDSGSPNFSTIRKGDEGTLKSHFGRV